MDSSGEKRTMTSQGNPLLISTVINCVFEYLPLKDLKRCRVVCQDWNSASIQILNKHSKVKLESNERITNFIEFYKRYDNDTQTFPFTTFYFFCHEINGITADCKQLTDLFKTLRNNMTTLIFVNSLHGLNLNPLIEIASNLVSITLTSRYCAVQLDKLAKVKYISLDNCHVSLDSLENRIAPLSISLNLVSFNRNNIRLPETLINDYIDFSRCSEIHLVPYWNSVFTFDLSRDAVSARIVDFHNIRIINSGETPAKLDKRMLPFEKHTGIGIKQLNFRSSELNLSLLPKLLEKLLLDRNSYVTVNCGSIDLPHLKCFVFRPLFNVSTAGMSPTAYDMGIITSMFQLCPKLVDMELIGWCSNDWSCNINVDFMPVTLKRIKLTNNKNIHLVGDAVIQVDSLILDTGTFADAKKFLNKIKPIIVVVQLQDSKMEDPAGEIVSFVEESWKLEKIVLQLPSFGDSRALRSYKRTLSNYIDDDEDGESNCYGFTNADGKCLTREEFKMYWS